MTQERTEATNPVLVLRSERQFYNGMPILVQIKKFCGLYGVAALSLRTKNLP